MNMGANPTSEYLRSSVMTASPEGLHLLLIDGAIRYALRAKEAMAEKDFEAMFNSLDRAQRIAIELTTGLNREANPAVVDPMRALYQFVYSSLVKANMHRLAQPIDDAVRILRTQRETWQLIVDKINREGARPAPATSAGRRHSDEPTPSAFVAEG